MNQADLLRSRNRVAVLVRHQNRCGSHRNCVRMSAANSALHELAKATLSLRLICQGHEIITEAIFSTGGRADVLDLDTGTAYEIVCSEDDKSLESKAHRYPELLEVVKVEATKGTPFSLELTHTQIRGRRAEW